MTADHVHIFGLTPADQIVHALKRLDSLLKPRYPVLQSLLVFVNFGWLWRSRIGDEKPASDSDYEGGKSGCNVLLHGSILLGDKQDEPHYTRTAACQLR
jgi:hypothetical protein